jgi:selenocysteine lyase/cysteine desulfurase
MGVEAERELLAWFKEWIGYPPDASGAFVHDGSAANLAALACALETRAGGMRNDLVLYVSDQANASIAEAARSLGFLPEQVRVLPSDDRFRLAPGTLLAAITADLGRNLTPFCVAAVAGSETTGSVDPLDDLAEVGRDHGAWLHVDAHYGGFAALADPVLLPGLAHADSVTLDLHGWLQQPSDSACVLIRDGHALRSNSDLAGALELLVSLRDFGLEAIREASRRSLELADAAAQRVEESETLALIAPPSLGVICFRRSDLDETANASLAASADRVSTAQLHSRLALRISVFDRTAEDVETTLAFLETAEPEAPGPARQPHPPIVSAWPGLPQADVASLRELPLFAGLEPGQAAQVAARGTLREVAAGETVIEQWDLGAEFFLIVDGTATVTVGGERTRDLGRGDFFGELRGLEWAAGYSYARTASVRATSPLRLLVFPEGALAQLVDRYPSLEHVIREAVAERLPRHS